MQDGLGTDQVKRVLAGLNKLIVFRSIGEDLLIEHYRRALMALGDDQPDQIALLSERSEFLRVLLERAYQSPFTVVGDIWQDQLMNLILFNDNIFVRQAALSSGEDHLLTVILQNDLRQLSLLCREGGNLLAEMLAAAELDCRPADLVVPEKKIDPVNQAQDRLVSEIKQVLLKTADWGELAARLITFYRQAGVGQLCQYRAFRWDNGLTGVRFPDPIRLEHLVGYEEQRRQVLENTARLVSGLPAHNLLLYGDRGTGKSSTVKAMLHEFGDRGLRLVQLLKKDVSRLPEIIQSLQDYPQYFIIFIDDLSFEETETEYKELKALLEGSVEKQPVNIRFYVTSNRYHLIKEKFSDRELSDELHENDTVQEKLSLADRFGMKITFLAPDKAGYLTIVRELARMEGLEMETERLEALAMQWTKWQNDRSGRTARQFIDNLIGR